MTTTTTHVIDQIARRGGEHSARFLSILLSEYLRPRETRDNDHPEFLPPESDLDTTLTAAERFRAQASGTLPFNLIPESGSLGSCCPLLVGVALLGFTGRSSGRRLTFPDLTVRVAAHVLRCHGTHRETLILTPDWSQTAFESRLAPLYEAFQKTGRPAFVVETGRTGLILRWPW